MVNLITIPVKINTSDEVSFLRLLNEIGNIYKELKWSILYLKATGDLGAGIYLGKFQEEIANSPRGLIIAWPELIDLSYRLYEVIEVTLVGVEDVNLLKRYKTEHDLFLNSSIVIEMIDGHLWRIYSSNIFLINHLTKVFKDVKYET